MAKIEGYAAVFNSRTDLGAFCEEVAPGAFDSVLASSPDVRALFNHDANHVLGRTKAGTLRLSVDSRGLKYSIDPPETQTARDLVESLRRGDISQSSFGFVAKRDEWREDGNGNYTRRILEFADLLDVSPVTYPAYSDTTSGVRSAPTASEDAGDDMRRLLLMHWLVEAAK